MCKMRIFNWIVTLAAAATLCACAASISGQLRREARRDLTVAEVQQNPQQYVGDLVIWGGKILNTVNNAQGTRIYILDLPLGWRQRPESEEASRGRFIAISPDFLDAALYEQGRKVTVAGRITGSEALPIGDYNYTYPVVGIEQIHLWQKEDRYLPPSSYYWGDIWDNAPFPYGWAEPGRGRAGRREWREKARERDEGAKMHEERERHEGGERNEGGRRDRD